MVEHFDISYDIVCPACSKDCKKFVPCAAPKFIEVEKTMFLDTIDGVRDEIKYKDAVQRKMPACENEDICKYCWEQSVLALNKIANGIPFRTVWGEE